MKRDTKYALLTLGAWFFVGQWIMATAERVQEARDFVDDQRDTNGRLFDRMWDGDEELNQKLHEAGVFERVEDPDGLPPRYVPVKVLRAPAEVKEGPGGHPSVVDFDFNRRREG